MDMHTAPLSIGTLGSGDRARFWRAAAVGDVDFLHAAFRLHRYAPHSHDTYVAGAIIAGHEAYTVRGARHVAGPGDMCFVNPGEVHDGAPADNGYVYRMSYPAIGLLTDLAGEITGRVPRHAPFFRLPVVHDPSLAALFVSAHERLERQGTASGADLGAEEALVRAYGVMLRRYADLDGRPMPLRIGGARIARVRDLLETCYADPVGLTALCEVAGLGRSQLLRAFRQATGLTPHAYLVDRRVRAARDLLRRGEAPGAVAAAVGFCDQAHLTRAFKERFGVTPGRYRLAQAPARSIRHAG